VSEIDPEPRSFLARISLNNSLQRKNKEERRYCADTTLFFIGAARIQSRSREQAVGKPLHARQPDLTKIKSTQ
jgi:hypothetical protein